MMLVEWFKVKNNDMIAQSAGVRIGYTVRFAPEEFGAHVHFGEFEDLEGFHFIGYYPTQQSACTAVEGAYAFHLIQEKLHHQAALQALNADPADARHTK